MTRGVRLFVVGSVALVTLAGCGRGWFQFAEREPWRREAEVACLKSGTVKESAGVVRIDAISGPGICGADYPLKVATLGASTGLGFADDVRPPGGIPGLIRNAPSPSYAPQNSGPVSLSAPGVAPARDDEAPDSGMDPGAPPAPSRPAYSRSPAMSEPLPRLGPAQGTQVAAVGPVEIKPAATLACPIVSELERWIAEAVQPAAVRWFGVPVAEIKQISAYSCRGMNGNANAHISEHAFGNALDIAAFTLADGRRISVKDGWKGLPEEQGFLRDVQGAACQQFNTVLAPGSNIYHYDHIHVDLMRRNSGRVICRPEAVAGDVVAARAGQRGRFAGRDPSITGSLSAMSRKLWPTSRRAAKSEDDDWVEDESGISDKGR